MAEASSHDKQMEDLMGAEVLMSGVEQRQLQRVDDSACGVDDPSGQKPAKGGGGKRPPCG